MGAMVDDTDMDTGAEDPAYTINVGISLEPLAVANSQLTTPPPTAAGTSSTALTTTGNSTSQPAAQTKAPEDAESIAVLANKIVQHAYNFLSSFTDAQNKVPMRAFDDWWAKFKSRLAADPKFLDGIS